MSNSDDHGKLRRRLLLTAPALLLGCAPSAQAALLTPSQTEGPFYPQSLPEERDSDLTLFKGETAPGEVIEVVGQVFDVKGAPAAGAEVQIWHCDINGAYAHVGQETVPNFQGYGILRADRAGAYRFRTTRPGVYPGRTRHIHVKARRVHASQLTTQMYFPGEAGNDRDGLLQDSGAPHKLIAREETGPPPRYVFDIVAP